MKYLSFDIEISDIFDLAVGEDIEDHGPLHISIASTAVYGGEERLWYSVGKNNKPLISMSQNKAFELLEYLDTMQKQDYMICSWNGLKFDLKWIGYMAQDLEYAAEIARKSYDVMFQFFNQRGFPVGLEAVGQAMGVKTKKIISGADAPKEWCAGNYELVQKYVMNDSRITNDIIAVILKQKEIRWITKDKKQRNEPISRLKSVQEILREPEPDQSWMNSPIRRSEFYEWFPHEAQ